MDDYVSFLTQVVDLYVAGKISLKVLEIACFPTYEWNTKLAENFQDERVIRLMGKLGELPDLKDEILIRIDQILSGEANAHILELRAAGQLP